MIPPIKKYAKNGQPMGGQVTGRKHFPARGLPTAPCFYPCALILDALRFDVNTGFARKDIPAGAGLTKQIVCVIIRPCQKEGLRYETLHCKCSCNGTGETLYGALRIRNPYPASPANGVKGGMAPPCPALLYRLPGNARLKGRGRCFVRGLFALF